MRTEAVRLLDVLADQRLCDDCGEPGAKPTGYPPVSSHEGYTKEKRSNGRRLPAIPIAQSKSVLWQRTEPEHQMILVDNSILGATATCSTLTALRYILGLTGRDDGDEARPLHVGSAIHAALERVFRGGSAADALAELRAAYALDALASAPEGDRLALPNVEAVMTHWLRTVLPGLPFRILPTDVELPFRVPLADGVEFTGRIDALAEAAGGGDFVVEHKSTGRLDERWRRRYKTASQVTGYVYAARALSGRPVVGCFINGIEVSKLPSDAKRKCAAHKTPYGECGPLHARSELLIELRSPMQLEQWRRDAAELALRFDALRERVKSLSDLPSIPMEGQFCGACGTCEFMDFCRVGRPLAQASSMLTAKPWEPGGPKDLQRVPGADGSA